MKIYLISISALLFIASPCFAEKPEWAGKGKPMEEQKEVRQTTMGDRKDSADEREGKREEIEKATKNPKEQKNVPKGLEKQRAKKMEQEQKELDRGSENGQQSRQERKKWWKFWGE